MKTPKLLPLPILGCYLRTSDGIKIYGIKETRNVQFVQNGLVYPFKRLPKPAIQRLFRAMMKDEAAKAAYGKLHWLEALENYTFDVMAIGEENDTPSLKLY